MEKLQAALEQARNKRGGGEAPIARQPRDTARKPNVATDSLWAALPAFQPQTESLIRHRVVTGAASAAAAPFDILRTKILLQMRQNNWSRLAITSPMPNTGKTTAACNLALAFGRQKELRTILFDADLRDPSVHEFFGYRPEISNDQLLRGEVDFQQQALRIGDNVAVSMANKSESDPTRILLSDKADLVLDDIQARYHPDLMIFDLPSVLVNDDTRAFLKNVDCALIVARANGTRYGQFDACEREVSENTNVLGVVLNAFRSGRASQDFA